MGRRVIVPLDGSVLAHAAVPYGAWLAAGRGAELVLVHVADGRRSSHAVEADLEVARVGAAMRATSVVRSGPDPNAEVAAEARLAPGSLVCSSTGFGRGPGAAPGAGLSTSLVAALACPLVLVGPACRPGPARVRVVMACLDASALSERVLPLVDQLATEMDLDVWLAQVVPLDPRGPTTRPEAEGGPSESLRRRARGMRRAITGCDVMRDPDPLAAIVQRCADPEGTMPAIATHGRRGAQLVLRAGVAWRVARECAEPVLVLPPVPALAAV